jgi:ssDNA-binding Zn-finger/Zn-ribbon topoisomerase 1
MDENNDVAICGPQLVYPDNETTAFVRCCTFPDCGVFSSQEVKDARNKVQGARYKA